VPLAVACDTRGKEEDLKQLTKA